MAESVECTGFGCGQGKRKEPRGSGPLSMLCSILNMRSPAEQSGKTGEAGSSLLSSPHPFSLKHMVKPSCERCPPYTWSRGAASSPKAQGDGGERQQTGRAQPPGHCTDLTPSGCDLPPAWPTLHHIKHRNSRSASPGLHFLIKAPPQGKHLSNKRACFYLITVLVTSIFTLNQGP